MATLVKTSAAWEGPLVRSIWVLRLVRIEAYYNLNSTHTTLPRIGHTRNLRRRFHNCHIANGSFAICSREIVNLHTTTMVDWQACMGSPSRPRSSHAEHAIRLQYHNDREDK